MSLLPDRAARAFPLLLLGLLTAVALVLDRMTQLPYFMPSNSHGEPDLTVYNFTATGFDVNGAPMYHLVADRMKHFPDDTADLDHPHMRRTEPGSEPLTVVGEAAHLSNRGNDIWFERNVTMRDEGSAQKAPVTVLTSKLAVDVPKGLIHSDAPTESDSKGIHMSTIGFDYNDKTGVLVMNSPGKLTYARAKH
ncbi:MAG: LPS export ABC transporter periplasmic protein LptC [Burkholderiales bacterium]|nr:LPS export ABC transporter periplasmic protein LptC [Burkholderiales bacterium]